MTTETSEQQRIEAIQAADKADDEQLIHQICDELRLEQILAISKSVTGSVSTETMTTLLEATEKSLDRLMLSERKVYIELKERPGVPKTAWYQMTIRLNKSFDLWRQLPSNYKHLKFLNLNETEWSEMKSRHPKMDIGDISRISIIMLFENAE